jgi:hypothetical protein
MTDREALVRLSAAIMGSVDGARFTDAIRSRLIKETVDLAQALLSEIKARTPDLPTPRLGPR